MNPAPASASVPASVSSSPGSDAPPRLVVRPPWPDELARVQAAFPEFSRFMLRHPLLMVVGDAPERIVGAASLGEPDARGMAGFSFVARPRWLTAESCGPLLAGIEAIARGLGVRRLVTTDDRGDAHLTVPVLRKLGFSDHRRIEFWSADLPTLQARLARIEARLVRAGRPHPFVVHPLAPEHLPAVRALLADDGGLAPEEITLKGAETGRGFDPGYSFVACEGNTLAGAILVRRIGREAAFVDAEAVAPAWRGRRGLVHHRLCAAAAARGLADGIATVIHAADTEKAKPAQRLARRSGGALKRTLLRLAKEL